MSSGWSWYISIIAIANILACIWLIRWTAKKRPGEASENETTGHSWDGLEELNKPMPRWWLGLFYATIVFSLVYLALYPGLGAYKGLLGWSQYSAYEEQVAEVEAEVAPLFARYAEIPIPQLANNEEAMQTGRRLFATNCAVCHGTDAGGRPGFPDLTDDAWNWGGTPEAIRTTILNGRDGVMPPMGAALGDDGIEAVTAYLYQLNGRDAPADLAARGETQFQRLCTGCHGQDASGNQALGAPSLKNNTWTWGGTREAIEATLRNGRTGEMPAHESLLGEDRVHLLAAYVYSLSDEDSESEMASDE